MDYSIQELTLLHESSNSRICDKSDRAYDQPTLIRVPSTAYPTSRQPICYNSNMNIPIEHFTPGVGKVWILQGGVP